MGGLFAKDIVALDITSRAITAVVGVKKAQSVFEIKADISREYSGFRYGEWVDEDETFKTVKDVLSEAMRTAKSKSKRVYIGIPAEFVAVASKEVTVTLDRKRRIVDDDISFLLKKGNDFASPDYTLINSSAVYFAIDGGQELFSDVRNMYANSIDGCVSYMFARKDVVSALDRLMSSLGFKSVRYIATSWAEGIALLDEEQRESAYMLIDIGYCSSSISIAKGEGVLDLKSFSMGGADIAYDISVCFGVSPETAFAAKNLVNVNLGYGEDYVLAREGGLAVYAPIVCEIVKHRWELIANAVEKALESVADAAPSYMPIYLTGEGIADMRGVREFFRKQLGRRVEILTPTLPGFTRAEDSSKTALLLVSDSLSSGIGTKMKKLFWR